ncbi:glycoside hydrolase family 29 (alpha-L- fucosidase) [Coraliomargarita akajimensis DSM 45221]|uniref:alpha-L-fucosidase n=2 Tax=Coraliomargarita TaxID=442430 RepID=D5ENQ2_CORAD|nr:glycoside hydrolase family 29 (alpha-L- fucosidase) [Coraliomargarita akajimensis DSM 45221]
MTACAVSVLVQSLLGQNHMPGQFEDGSAETYVDTTNGKPIVPRIEEKDGKRFYYWPNFHKWQNGKNQLHNERTTHPDAQWWPEAGLGLFLCWGMPSVFEPNGEGWSGRWTQDREDRGAFYPQTELWDSVEDWNPEDYNPKKWMDAAAKAGFKYSVLTLKHHGGYAIWDSDYALIGVRQSADGRCLVEPWVEACRENDIKVGFYYSGMDWYFERDYMNFSMQPGTIVNYKGEHVKSLPKRPASFSKAYEEFNNSQVKEVIAKFDPDIWWGDGGHGATADQIREWRPGVVLNNRGIGGGDHCTPEGFHMAEPQYVLKPIVENGWWWEVNAICQGGSWHYDKHAGERIFATESVLTELVMARSMGGNLLACIGPRPDGRMQEDAYRLFDEMAEWMETNQDSVFGINGGLAWPKYSSVPVTARDNVWFFHANKNQATEEKPVTLKQIAKKPVAVTLMRTGDAIPYEYSDGNLSFYIPQNLKAGKVLDAVIVEFGEDFDYKPYLFTHWK